jgi:hypothetical protein
MDARAWQHVAVVAGMQTLYGERADGLPSDCHADPKHGAAESSDPATLEHQYLGV